MRINIKRLSESAVLPKYSREGDAALDLTATSVEYTSMYTEYGTSIAVEIPDGYVGIIAPRSSITNYDLMLKNSVGVIDSNFRGEIRFRMYPTEGVRSKIYSVGDRIGQLMIIPIPKIEINEVTELSSTNREEGSYGSSGK